MLIGEQKSVCICVCVHTRVSSCMPACLREQVDRCVVRPGWTRSLSELHATLNEIDQSWECQLISVGS